MIKIVALIRRHPDMDPETFRTYWRDVHVPLVRERLPDLIHYTGAFPAGDAPEEVAIGTIGCDAIVELGFPDRATMEANMTSAAFLSDDRKASSARFMDEARSYSMVVEEWDVLHPE